MSQLPCLARQYSDEMVCSTCILRWDVNDPCPPRCQRSAPSEEATKPVQVGILDRYNRGERRPEIISDDRATLEKVAKGYNDLMALQAAQRETLALMMRACIVRLRHPDPRKQAEAIKGLEDLADMLEKKQ